MTKATERESGEEGSAQMRKEAEEVVRRQPLHNLGRSDAVIDHLNKIMEPHKEKVIASLARLSY